MDRNVCLGYALTLEMAPLENQVSIIYHVYILFATY
jgi:hypothetical protein